MRFLGLLALATSLLHCAAGGDTDTGPSHDVVNHDTRTDATDSPAPSDVTDVIEPMDATDTPPPMDVIDDASDASMPPMDVTRTDVPVDARTDAPVDRPDVCTPSTEVCNGLDDNCNGMVDETGCPGHLLVSEVVLTPNGAEFIEIYNPTSATISLDNVYLTDTASYAHMIDAIAPPAVDASDFVARFPAGTSIAAGAYQTVATGNPSGWPSQFSGACPTYHLQSTATLGTCTSSRLMRGLPVGPASIGTTATLTNTGEPIMLFQWDGASDLVQDIDYVYPGMPGATGTNDAIDKSMLFVDGPDSDTVASGYQLDTPAGMQSYAMAPPLGSSAVRCMIPMEPGETLNGGNGAFGHNETSERLATTWSVTMPIALSDGGVGFNASPNAANSCP